MSPNRLRITKGVSRFHEDATGVRQEHGGNQFEQGRLAAAVWSQENGNLARSNGKCHIFESTGSACSFAAKPVEYCGTMCEELADRLEGDRIHRKTRNFLSELLEALVS